MWRCPQCETVCKGTFCTVCGYKKPPVSQTLQGSQTPTVQPPKKEKNPYLLIGMIVCLFLLITVTVVGLWMYLVAYQEEDTVARPHQRIQEDAEKTEKPHKEQTEEPVAPEEPSFTVESAQVDGEAAIGEGDFKRHDIHLTNVEEYVSGTIRPIYQSIVNNTELQEVTKSDGVSYYFDNSSVAMVRYPAGTDGDPYERRYFFDTRNDELVFAFIFLGTEEHRMYFYKDSLIRYIDDQTTVTDNPTDDELLDWAERAIGEAYNYWD